MDRLLVSIYLVEILFALGFSVKRQKSLFTFESVCIILANSFLKNCQTCVKVQFLQRESKQTFPENLKFKKRYYHFQTEVVLQLLAAKFYYLRLKMVISFLRFEIFWESLFTFLWQKLHFDTSLTVLEKIICQNNAKGFKSKQTLLSFH